MALSTLATVPVTVDELAGADTTWPDSAALPRPTVLSLAADRPTPVRFMAPATSSPTAATATTPNAIFLNIDLLL